jgi:hypothetical protein
MLADHDLARRGQHRWVDELDGITDRWLPGVLALPKGFIALADLDVPRPKHGRTIAHEQTCLACRTLQTLGFLNHLPVHGVGDCTHDSGIKVSDEQRGVLAIRG